MYHGYTRRDERQQTPEDMYSGKEIHLFTLFGILRKLQYSLFPIQYRLFLMPVLRGCCYHRSTTSTSEINHSKVE